MNRKNLINRALFDVTQKTPEGIPYNTAILFSLKKKKFFLNT